MNSWTLIARSLRFHARAHLGVVLGAAVGSAALIGALLVGDSVRGSLRELALARLGRVDAALASNDRFFRAQLADEMVSPARAAVNPPKAAAALQLPGTASSADASARANHVQILGVDDRFWQLANQPPAFKDIPADAVVLNESLARQLKAGAGDTILLRVQKPSLLSRDAPISPQEDSSAAMRLKVQAIVSGEQFGRFSLQANQVAPFNAFINLAELQKRIDQPGRANLLLYAGKQNSKIGGPAEEAGSVLRTRWQLADAELELREVPATGGAELRSDRVFLDPQVVTAALGAADDAQPIITYFVNDLRDGPFATPYSMVTAMGAPIVPLDMGDDEIMINDWLANDLQAKPGEKLTLSYYVIGNGRALEERQSVFRIRGIVPLSGAAADPALMPDFPGLAKAESSSDWDAGFPIQLSRIRPQDEEYWKEHRGTPKAFVTLSAGRKMWANRFGEYTAIRFPKGQAALAGIREHIQKQLDPASVGLGFQPVREQALAASSQSTPFGQLFLGFSFFLIVAALLLMSLLFQFGLEQRTVETGTLLALGFRPRQVRRLLLWEGAALALAGGIIGTAGGILYAKAMLLGLTTVWKSAVNTSMLHYYATPETLATGLFSSVLVAVLTIWLALRRQARRPARELLEEGGVERGLRIEDGGWKRSKGGWIAAIAGVAAFGLVLWTIWQGDKTSAENFFSAGSLVLIAGLGMAAAWLGALARSGNHKPMTLGGLGLRSSARRRKRSLATIGLLACGAFLIAAVGAFRLDANQSGTDRSSGTGGFDLLGESALPVTYDLNSVAGRNFYGLNGPEMKLTKVVPFRVRDGDEASCLNLNRARQPRLLGVNPAALQKRGALTFSEVMKGLPKAKGWSLLQKNTGAYNPPLPEDVIPAIGDENAIKWAMQKEIGDTVDYTDEHGRVFKVRLVGAVANSILQGNLVIDEAEFVKRFPGESGYRMFLIDAASNVVTSVSQSMTRALQDLGLELTPTAQRLNEFNAVQNTYLNTFQVLGGLGLLLGSAGLAVVVLRNVQERRGELALLLAVGFRRGALRRLVLSEHGALLGLGLGVGVLAAAVSVLPALLSPGSQVPYVSLGVTLAAVLVNGLAWAWLATTFALRGRLLDALRNE